MINTFEDGKFSVETLWSTEAGELVPPSEMESTHLLNTIDYLQRRALTRPQHEQVYSDNVEIMTRELVHRSQ